MGSRLAACGSKTSNWAIIPWSSWSSMWQCTMKSPGKSVNLAATSTYSPGSRRQVSSRPRSHGGGFSPLRLMVCHCSSWRWT